jgi:hypothetical protein
MVVPHSGVLVPAATACAIGGPSYTNSTLE